MLSSNRFLLLLSNSRILYSRRGQARLDRASYVGIRYAIYDGRLLFYDRYARIADRSRSISSYRNAANRSLFLLHIA